MISLLLDSANRDLNIGLSQNDKIFDRISYTAWQRQSELMVKEIDVLLKRNNLSAKDIDELIVTIGPGSYTGIRIALTIAKTLAFALNKKIYAISSLAALRVVDKKTITVINARSNRSYVAIYDGDGTVLVEEKVWPNDELLGWVNNGNRDFVVSGDAKYLGIDAYNPDVLQGMLEARKHTKAVDNVLTLKPIYLKDLL
ncbi:MAG: tRNA (adenosine(37)-N6)-threonylcarbamoyltransferase complex dimerization subunit type 1 TsaB [Bacilli bacterium]|nr:tRNA (adenosine(37)-N6)-threonylcarbamoyltransferase complex dimerization subunit type 1 TsaB [Bacilli bacterium]